MSSIIIARLFVVLLYLSTVEQHKALPNNVAGGSLYSRFLTLCRVVRKSDEVKQLVLGQAIFCH